MATTADSAVSIEDREKIAKEIAKTSSSIRKKVRALKTGRIEEDIALERHFRPVIEPLKQIAKNAGDATSDSVLINADVEKKYEDTTHMTKRKRSNPSSNDSFTASTPLRPKWLRLFSSTNIPVGASTPKNTSHKAQSINIPNIGIDVPSTLTFEPSSDSFVTSVRRELQTSKGHETLRSHLGPLGQRYFGAILGSDKDKTMDYVYGVHFTNDGAKIGDKVIDVDKDDNIIIDGREYRGTRGLYELIFKRMPNTSFCTEEDKQTYKNILLTTNAHRREHKPSGQILSNKGHKYKFVIAPLFSQGLPIRNQVKVYRAP
jgi:hypothetical protein